MENILHFQSDKMENGMEWNGMENGKDFIFGVKWKGKKMEWKRNGKQNGKFLGRLSGMEKEWKGNGMESGMESF